MDVFLLQYRHKKKYNIELVYNIKKCINIGKKSEP